MKRLYLVSCSSKKRSERQKAEDMYISPSFKYAREIIQKSGFPWFILSAKHGLLSPDKRIEPYDMTLNEMGVEQRRKWAKGVIRDMEKKLPDVEEVVVFAPAKYREFLEDYLNGRFRVEVPMEGLKIGEQQAWLKKKAGY